jgi:nicotinate phosphoribosyltransferase
MKNVEQGPLIEGGMLTAGLDYYKPTMSQVLLEQEPGAEVTFTFSNRGEQRIADYVSPEDLLARFDWLAEQSWQESEIGYLKTLHDSNKNRIFSDTYLEHLANNDLPPVQVRHDEEANDIAIEAKGPAPMVTFWETVVMSEVNEAYFEGYVSSQGIDLMEVYEEGNKRLSKKIEILKENPQIKFADFGTRRHFSLRWQKHVLNRLKEECPDNFLGTSNVALANILDEKPIGTFAHEMPMIYAGLADARGEDIKGSHNTFLKDWYGFYGEDLSTALTDTFGTEFFFADFSPDQAEKWKALRHDSGDPFEFGEKVIEFYEANGIDPRTKTIVFSDGLDIDTIVSLNERFEGRIGNIYGWGTTLTNDLAIKPLNIVMKATHTKTAEGDEAFTVKLSDTPGKHTGPAEKIEEYKNAFTKTTIEI